VTQQLRLAPGVWARAGRGISAVGWADLAVTVPLTVLAGPEDATATVGSRSASRGYTTTIAALNYYAQNNQYKDYWESDEFLEHPCM
jgi:hypothetical protein